MANSSIRPSLRAVPERAGTAHTASGVTPGTRQHRRAQHPKSQWMGSQWGEALRLQAAWLEHSPSGHALPGSRSSSVSPDRRSAAGLHVELSAGWDPLHPQPHRWGCNPKNQTFLGSLGKGRGRQPTSLLHLHLVLCC